MIRQVCSLAVITVLLICISQAQEVNRLEPGRSVERDITGGKTHTYQISLAAGQFLRVVVDQRAIDVALALMGPEGKPLIESDLTGIVGGRESLCFEAGAARNYQIVVRANGDATQSGAYEMRTDIKAKASAQDRQRMTAELLLNEARKLLTQGKYTDPQLTDKLGQSLTLWRDLDDRYWQGLALNSVGVANYGTRQFDKAIERYEQALALVREEKVRAVEATVLNNMGNAYGGLSRYDKAVECYQQVLAIRRELKDRRGEAASLFDVAWTYERMSRYDKALESFQAALTINRELKNRREEGRSLSGIGWINNRLNRPDKAIGYSQEALAIAREVKNRYDESQAINTLASAYNLLKQYDRAAENGEQYLSIVRELKDRYSEAIALQNLANYYRNLLRYEKAVDNYGQALAVLRGLKARQDEALVLANMGGLFSVMTRLDKAVECYEQALPIYREINDRQGEANVLGPLANAYALLGRSEKAIEYFELALPINRDFKNHFRTSNNLNGLANANQDLGKYEKAIEFYEQALVVARENKIRGQEGSVLGNIGETYQLLGRNDKAVEYLRQALVIVRETKNLGAETGCLRALGDALRGHAQYPEATSHHEQALRLARQIRNRNLEGKTLQSLMRDWQAQNKPTLAVFFGKQAVNLYQEIRSEITSLERESQQAFVKSKEDVYRTLADLLISQGRLPEAEQVIRMLKEEEYFEFVRRDEGNSPKTLKATLTPEEQTLEKRYREIADRVAELGVERGTLIERKTRTPEEEQRLVRIDADLVVAGNAFQSFLSSLESEVGSSSDTGSKIYAMRESQGLMEDLRELGKGAVALYTLVGADKYRVILTTSDFQKGYEYPIKAADLNRKVLEFREVLQNPKYDPLPLAQELYRILLGPVAKDLKAAKAETLMWSLDGVLRYLPVAALHDGKQYLIEKYRNAVFTPASQARLKDVPSRQWTALGLGVTKAHGERIPALPGVLEEMHGVIREGTENSGGAKAGVLPGTIKLDEQFTQEAMLTALRQRPPVVHVASHFQFQPGDETSSALLLGDGSFLSLAQIKTLPNLFGGVELLTLSACNTATGGSGANGKEVEGFAVLAQRQGAKAVVASLWPVADRSTKVLMQEFYRLREAKSNTTKAEALREAQLKLLRGDITIEPAATLMDRKITHEDESSTTSNKPRFTTDPKKPYAHPYYWAPFILIGNWR